MVEHETTAVAPKRRRVLFLTPFFPWPLNLGARQRVFHLARGLAATDDVSVIAFDTPPAAADVEGFLEHSGCSHVTVVERVHRPSNGIVASSHAARLVAKIRSVDEHVRSPLPTMMREIWSDALVDAIATEARERPVDFVFAARYWMAEHARAAGVGPIVLDVDDITSAMAQRHLESSGWHRRKLVQMFDVAKDRKYERSLPKRFDRLVVVKDADREFFATSTRGRIDVLPNGVDVPKDVMPEPDVADTLLFVGTLGYGPNIDAIRWFAQSVLPLIWAKRADVQFTVAGFGSGSAVADVLTDARCTLYESPPDLSPLYRRAAVVVTPVRLGGGTRIKILEALGHGRAVVSTEFAAEGLDLRAGVDLDFANTPEDMAAKCLALLGDRARRQNLAAAGRDAVSQRFDWSRIEASLTQLAAGFGK